MTTLALTLALIAAIPGVKPQPNPQSRYTIEVCLAGWNAECDEIFRDPRDVIAELRLIELRCVDELQCIDVIGVELSDALGVRK